MMRDGEGDQERQPHRPADLLGDLAGERVDPGAEDVADDEQQQQLRAHHPLEFGLGRILFGNCGRGCGRHRSLRSSWTQGSGSESCDLLTLTDAASQHNGSPRTLTSRYRPACVDPVVLARVCICLQLQANLMAWQRSRHPNWVSSSARWVSSSPPSAVARNCPCASWPSRPGSPIPISARSSGGCASRRPKCCSNWRKPSGSRLRPSTYGPESSIPTIIPPPPSKWPCWRTRRSPSVRSAC